ATANECPAGFSLSFRQTEVCRTKEVASNLLYRHPLSINLFLLLSQVRHRHDLIRRVDPAAESHVNRAQVVKAKYRQANRVARPLISQESIERFLRYSHAVEGHNLIVSIQPLLVSRSSTANCLNQKPFAALGQFCAEKGCHRSAFR